MTMVFEDEPVARDACCPASDGWLATWVGCCSGAATVWVIGCAGVAEAETAVILYVPPFVAEATTVPTPINSALLKGTLALPALLPLTETVKIF